MGEKERERERERKEERKRKGEENLVALVSHFLYCSLFSLWFLFLCLTVTVTGLVSVKTRRS